MGSIKNKEDDKSRISIYPRSPYLSPSGYYRLTQYIEEIDGIEYRIRPLLSDQKYHDYLLRKNKGRILSIINSIITYLIILFNTTRNLIHDLLWKPDYIIVSKVFIPKYTPFFVKWLVNKNLKKAKLVWDFDDDILEGKQLSQKTFTYLSNISEAIVVTHDQLKNLTNSSYHHKVTLLPTTDGDMFNRFHLPKIFKKRSQKFINEVILIWVATAGNLIHLESILEQLDNAARDLKLQQGKLLSLKVICNKALEANTDYLNVINIKWTREVAINEMCNSHIGIMPLLDTKFAKGKGGFKLIQYFSIGLPVIASNVGFNSSIVNKNCGSLVNDKNDKSGWYDEIIKLISSDFERIEQLGENAYNRYLNDYSFEDNLKTWKKILDIN